MGCADHPRHGRGRRDGAARLVHYAGQKVEEQDARASSPTRIILTPPRCSPPCPSAPTARRLPSIPGVVPGKSTARPAACSTRAAAMPSNIACASSRRADGLRGEVLCHYPLAPACRDPTGHPGRECRGRSDRVPPVARRRPPMLQRRTGASLPVGRGLFGHATLEGARGASFKLFPGRTLAVVGESGCGKFDARPHRHDDRAADRRLAQLTTTRSPRQGRAMRKLRPKVQIVFQNPYGSLNPRKKIGPHLEEPLLVNTKLSPPSAGAGARMLAMSGCARSITRAIRTCSRAASASASPSPAHSCSTRRSCSWTSRSRPSTSRSRPRC